MKLSFSHMFSFNSDGMEAKLVFHIAYDICVFNVGTGMTVGSYRYSTVQQ